jgi:hypothetical protein
VQVVGMKQEIKDYLTSKNVPWEEVRGCLLSCMLGGFGIWHFCFGVQGSA